VFSGHHTERMVALYDHSKREVEGFDRDLDLDYWETG
jgi:hypothetical protein